MFDPKLEGDFADGLLDADETADEFEEKIYQPPQDESMDEAKNKLINVLLNIAIQSNLLVPGKIRIIKAVLVIKQISSNQITKKDDKTGKSKKMLSMTFGIKESDANMALDTARIGWSKTV